MPQRIPEKHVKTLISMRSAGKRPEEIAATTGLRASSVITYLSILKNKHGLKWPRFDVKWTPERLQELADEVRTKTYQQAAERHGVSGARIAHLMRRHTDQWLDAQRRRDMGLS